MAKGLAHLNGGWLHPNGRDRHETWSGAYISESVVADGVGILHAYGGQLRDAGLAV